MIGTFAVDQFFLRVKALAAVAVKPAVVAEVNVACVVNLLQHLAHVFLVVIIGRANEVIVGDAASVPGRAK